MTKLFSDSLDCGVFQVQRKPYFPLINERCITLNTNQFEFTRFANKLENCAPKVSWVFLFTRITTLKCVKYLSFNCAAQFSSEMKNLEFDKENSCLKLNVPNDLFNSLHNLLTKHEHEKRNLYSVINSFEAAWNNYTNIYCAKVSRYENGDNLINQHYFSHFL